MRGLATIIQQSQCLSSASLTIYVQTRSFAAVLFRRIAQKTRKVPGSSESRDLFLTLQEGQQIAIRTKLLECLAKESVGHVRNKIGDAIAEVARQYTDERMCNVQEE